uniref:RRM domain-containing protein n=1 Tax=Angiostrongylus cantonensis TaxID=6313 RepID=A0A158PBI9_ANGCA
MVSCQDSRGKRRRSGPLEDKGPSKKPRNEGGKADGTSLVSEVENKREIKKKRCRKRTKGLRVLIKNKIEVALRTPSSPLAHLFVTRDDDGTPQAAYVDVIKAIGLTDEDWLKAASLSPGAVESISNITDMFRIEKNQEKKLMLKYRPVEWNRDECTVYLDNLPAGCTSEKIFRIAKKFGSVVEVRLPRSPSRKIFSPYGLLEVGKHPRSFAFVLFTESAACKREIRQNNHNGGEHNTCIACGGEGRRPSISKRKKMKEHCNKLLNTTPEKKKRKRRRRRKAEVGSHAIVGSVSDYFAKIQVFPLVRYLELRRQYVALRRESDRYTKELTRQDGRFSDFSSFVNNVKLSRQLESYRDNFWEIHDAEQEE